MLPAGALAKGDAWFLTIATTSEGDAVIWRVAGRLGTAGAAALQQQVHNVSAVGGRRLVLDLQGVDYLSGAGVRAIEGLARAVHEGGGTLELTKLTEPVRISVDLAGPLPYVDVAPAEP